MALSGGIGASGIGWIWTWLDDTVLVNAEPLEGSEAVVVLAGLNIVMLLGERDDRVPTWGRNGPVVCNPDPCW